jgi:hypothetical protein
MRRPSFANSMTTTGLDGRRGAALPWFVVTMPLLVLVAAWVIQTAELRERRLELGIAAEAAVLAGADALADDRLLTDDADRQLNVEKSVREAARRFGDFNEVFNRRLQLDLNEDNRRGGELTIGTLPDPYAGAFTEAFQCGAGGPDLYRPNRNTVRVACRRSRVGESAAAFVDRDVIGFQLQGTLSLPGRSEPSIPLMPLALLSDPGREEEWAQKDPRSWECAILARKGGDAYGKRPEDHEVHKGADGIPELRVTLGGNGRVLRVGAGDVARQILTGFTGADLDDRGGRLLLDGDGQRPNVLRLPEIESASDGDGHRHLAESLQQVLGQPRVWMLYSTAYPSKAQSKDEPSDPKKEDGICVIGFVAARLLAVDPEGAKGPLQFVVQPSMLLTATAVTDHARRDGGPRTLFNPYIGKVRLID